MAKKIIKLKARSRKIALKHKMDNLSDNEVADILKKTSKGFLKSKEWRELRAKALELYGLVCVKCGRDNSKKYPINVDHIKPRKFFPDLALDITNLQPLCGPCNKIKGNHY
jgi:5-methylcytosine-specific restriction endonuclease McrA